MPRPTRAAYQSSDATPRPTMPASPRPRPAAIRACGRRAASAPSPVAEPAPACGATAPGLVQAGGRHRERGPTTRRRGGVSPQPEDRVRVGGQPRQAYQEAGELVGEHPGRPAQMGRHFRRGGQRPGRPQRPADVRPRGAARPAIRPSRRAGCATPRYRPRHPGVVAPSPPTRPRSPVPSATPPAPAGRASPRRPRRAARPRRCRNPWPATGVAPLAPRITPISSVSRRMCRRLSAGSVSSSVAAPVVRLDRRCGPHSRCAAPPRAIRRCGRPGPRVRHYARRAVRLRRGDGRRRPPNAAGRT